MKDLMVLTGFRLSSTWTGTMSSWRERLLSGCFEIPSRWIQNCTDCWQRYSIQIPSSRRTLHFNLLQWNGALN